ncbi:hypothetical protein ACEPPN_017035 [Leptodophora sp. 'Broadleaf-Isolate-01']
MLRAVSVRMRGASSTQFSAVDPIDAYINVVGTIPLAPIEAMIPDHDIKTRDEPEPEPELESNIEVLIDPETPTAEELNLNFIVAYDIAEYDVID